MIIKFIENCCNITLTSVSPLLLSEMTQYGTYLHIQEYYGFWGNYSTVVITIKKARNAEHIE